MKQSRSDCAPITFHKFDRNSLFLPDPPFGPSALLVHSFVQGHNSTTLPIQFGVNPSYHHQRRFCTCGPSNQRSIFRKNKDLDFAHDVRRDLIDMHFNVLVVIGAKSKQLGQRQF
jgi:hypothetical protein